jgi:hypothetical protein
MRYILLLKVVHCAVLNRSLPSQRSQFDELIKFSNFVCAFSTELGPESDLRVATISLALDFKQHPR